MKISLTAIVVLLIPFSLVSAQEKKTEKKIKIITNDGSGQHVVIDTLFTGNGPDSMKLKDGSVVYLSTDDNSDIMPGDGKQQIFIASSSDNADNGVTREITIVASDSSDSNSKGDMTDEDTDSGVDKSRYVIAKDGIVVTVEGTDEAKTQALAKEIREKLGVKSDSDKK